MPSVIGAEHKPGFGSGTNRSESGDMVADEQRRVLLVAVASVRRPAFDERIRRPLTESQELITDREELPELTADIE